MIPITDEDYDELTNPQGEQQTIERGPAIAPIDLPAPAPAQAPTLMMIGGPAARAREPETFDFPSIPPGPAQAPTLMGAQAPTLMGGSVAGYQLPTAAQLPTQLTGPPVQVMDVTPRGLGIGTVAGFCEELIRRNSRLPAEIKRMFTTSRDKQQTVRIRVCQGESRRIDENLVVGELVLDGLEARPRGETTIEVTFAIDASGILQVRARDARTGQERRASLDVLGAQSADEVDAARNRLQQLRG
jgi:molecular chaperone DnaK